MAPRFRCWRYIVGHGAAERLEAVGEVIGGHEIGEARSELVVALVVEAPDGRLFDRRSVRSI